MFKDSYRTAPPRLRTETSEPSRLDDMIENVKLALQNTGMLKLNGAPGCDPYNSRLGKNPGDNWRRLQRRR